ncbi:MAG TPA: peptide chain release factor-like protein [Myxococcales bacterium]|nr:peptide chain release factor-like protein [Myxococcales bacterium]
MTPEELARRLAAKRSLSLPQEALLAECDEAFFTSGGPGGQHRNKTESGVRLTHRPTEISVTATERRSQARNRSAALERLREALAELSVIPRQRRATRPTKASQRRRLDDKKHHAAKKAQRRGER